MGRFYRIVSPLPYLFTCKIANEGINASLLSPEFRKQVGITAPILYVEDNQAELLEAALQEFHVLFDIRDLNKEYIAYKQSHESTALPDGIVVIAEKEFVAPYYVLSDGRVRLREDQVAIKNSIKIYCESNEKCRHHIPHVHVSINGLLNLCSISIVDQKLLASGKHFRKDRFGEYVELLTEYKEEAKEKWNSCHNLCKFIRLEDGTLSDEYTSNVNP